MFLGNQKAVKYLGKCLEKGIVAQSYLFSGPESVGKFMLAKAFAEILIEGKSTTILRNMEAGEAGKTSLDLLVLEPEVETKKGVAKEKEIKIEKIREVQKDLALYPYSGKYKVLIINNAHRMTQESQNALLKILEEPNPTSIIILVTHEEDKILATIQSRCQKVRFSLVSPQDLKLNLRGVGEEIISLSLGRPGLAIKMAGDKEEFDFRSDAAGDLKNIARAGINERLKMAEKLSRNIPETQEKLQLWIGILHGRAIDDVNSYSALKIFAVIEKIENSLWELKNTNANGRLILENLLLSL